MWHWIAQHWEFVVGTAIGVLGIIIAIATVAYQRSPKRLDYKIMSDIRVLNIDADPKWEVLYDGRKIEDPRIVVIRFVNTGKQPIRADDFEGGLPIRVTYEMNGYWSASVVAPSEYEDLGLANVENNSPYAITPKLLNAGESFDVQFLSEKPHGAINIAARFSGQARPMHDVDVVIDRTGRTLSRAFAALTLTVLILLGIGILSEAVDVDWLGYVEYLLIAGASFSLIFYVIYFFSAARKAVRKARKGY